MQRFIRFVLIVGAALLGLFLIMRGLLSIYGMDFHENPLLSLTYCTLPFLALPALFFALRRRRLVVLPTLLAAAYLADYSALNWRTCASVGYCGGMASTVLMTLKTPAVLAYFGLAILSFGAMSAGRKRSVDAPAGK